MAINDPVPSTAFDVLQRNVQDVDRYLNTSTVFNNRVGLPIKPIPMQAAEWQTAIGSVGWFPVGGDFFTGATLTARNQVIYDPASTAWYSWGGALPKIVPAASSPASTGGISAGAWTMRSDAALATALNNGTALINGLPASALAAAAAPSLATSVKALSAAAKGVQLALSFSTDGAGAQTLWLFDPAASAAAHNGVTALALAAINAWTGNASGIPSLMDWSGSGAGVFFRVGYSSLKAQDVGAGAVAGPATNAAIVSRLLALGGVVINSPDEVQTSGVVTVNGSKDIDFLAVDVVSGGFEFVGAVNPWATVSAVTNVYSGTIPGFEVAGINCARVTFAAAHSYVVGDVLKVASDTQYDWTDDPSKAGFTGIVIKLDALNVWLDCEADTSYTYTKATKITDRVRAKLRFKNASEGTADELVQFKNYKDSQIAVEITESLQQGVTLSGVFNSQVILIATQMRNYNGDQTKWGYGIVDRSAERCQIAVFARSLRHAYTTTHGGTDTNPWNYGEPRDNVITGQGNNCVAPFDTHASGDGLVFYNAFAETSYAAGFTDRAKATTMINCISRSRSDVAFHCFSNVGPSVTKSRGGLTQLVNCKSFGSKRALRVGPQSLTANTLAPSFRFRVRVQDFYAEADVVNEAILLRNADLDINNATIVNTSNNSSVTAATYTEGNPINYRAFVTLVNSAIRGSYVEFKKTGSAQNLAPFLMTINALNPSAECVAAIDHLTLNNLDTNGFSDFAEMIVSGALQGKKPSDGALDYTAGLSNTFASFPSFNAVTKTRSALMRADVLAFYAAARGSQSGMYQMTAADLPVTFNKSWVGLTDNRDIVFTTTPAVYTNDPKSLNLIGFVDKMIVVRCVPSRPSGESGDPLIDITEIVGMQGASSEGQQIIIINDSTVSAYKVRVSAANVFPSDTTAYGTGVVARLTYTGTKFIRG